MEENINAKIIENLEGAEPLELAKAIYRVLDSKKAKKIRILKVEEKTSIADYFVICTGNSGTQVKSLAGEVEFATAEAGYPPIKIEGRSNVSWIVVDYGPVIVHIQSRDARDFYNLDKLYSDAPEIEMEQTED